MTGSVPGRQPGASAPAPPQPTSSARALATIGLTAAVMHGLFDAVTAQVPLLVPTYLRLHDAPEEFQMLSPVAVSIAVSCVSGVIAVICVAAVLPTHRKPRLLGAMIAAFWLFSAVLLKVVWLSTPWAEVAWALVPGLLRGAAIGWVAAAIASRAFSGRTAGVA